MTVTSTVPFEAPGRGEWQCLIDHYPASVSPEYRVLVESTLPAGLTSAFQRFGIPAKGMALKWLNGRPYLQPIPMVGRPGSLTPPKPVLWFAIRLHPMARRCVQAATRALADRPWRDDAARWYGEQRPAWIERNLALQGVDLDALDDGALAEHLIACRTNAHDGYRLHFELHGPDFIPTGLLLSRGEDWGFSHDEIFETLEGSSPASRGEDTDAELHRWRLVTSYDIDGRTLGELPGLAARAEARTPADPAETQIRAEEAAAKLRVRVPIADQEEFDDLLEDARLTYGIRDDNGGITGAWSVGLLRRSYLEAGRRLAARDAISDPAHVFELLADEVASLLGGASDPSPTAVADRAAQRTAESAVRAPAKLGPAPPAVPFDALPAPLALIGRAQLLIAEGLHSAVLDDPLSGTGVGQQSYRGRAVVALDPGEALDRLEPGDILVTRATTPAWNVALSLAGGLVVEEAGLLSHAAVMARELGLIAVLGAAGATAAVADGAMVEIDPVVGRVTVVDAKEQ